MPLQQAIFRIDGSLLKAVEIRQSALSLQISSEMLSTMHTEMASVSVQESALIVRYRALIVSTHPCRQVQESHAGNSLSELFQLDVDGISGIYLGPDRRAV